MEKIYELVKDKELVVHKRIVSIIEKVLRAFDLDFNHDRYKKIIYDECEFNTPLELKIKRFYDGFIFLVNNKKTAILGSFLKRFYYLTTNIEMNDYISTDLASKFFYLSGSTSLEQAIIFHIDFYNVLSDLEEYERTLISIMILNYILLKNDIPLIHMVRREVIKYMEYRDMYISGEKKYLNEFIQSVISKNKYQDKSFYNKLKPLSLYEIEEILLSNKESIQKKFKVNKLMLFGSFFKGNYRFDSDIDLLIIFKEEISYEEKCLNVEGLKNYLYKIFNRYIDIHEIFYKLTDSFLTETNKVKIIF